LISCGGLSEGNERLKPSSGTTHWRKEGVFAKYEVVTASGV